MPRSPLQIVTDELSRNPREYEYLDLGDTDGWSEADKQDVVAALLAAAAAGDARAPTALWGLMPREWLSTTFANLLATSPPAVAVQAGEELAKLVAAQAATALEPLVAGRALDPLWLGRAVDLLLAVGDDSGVRRMLHETIDEDLRTVLIDKLWNQAGFYMYPQVWWTSLGLLRTQLMLALPSFRAHLLNELDQLTRTKLVADSYPPVVTPVSPALRAAIADVEGGQGAPPDALLAPLSSDEKTALVAYAAGSALSSENPRGVTYVAKLSGQQHRDLFVWASTQSSPALAKAGKDALGT